jgi:5-dehydro-2-deoxygluconokinase
MTGPFEVLTMGRIGVDIYPLQVGARLEDVTSFGKYLGGSATNVAVAASRLGRRSAVITGTGDDPFGRFLHRALRGFGVDDRFVTTVPGLPTPITFCEIFPPDDFPIYFYRYPKAPDLELKRDELDMAAIRAADVFWVTVTGLSQEPSRSATLAALAERAKARRWVQEALPHATIAVGNLDECETATGSRDPEKAGRALLDFGVDLAVLKQGPAGVLALDRTREVRVRPLRVEVVNGIGAGDAFGGALCHGLLAGWDTAAVMRFANAAGAIVASRLACADAMPTDDEVRELLAEHADDY